MQDTIEIHPYEASYKETVITFILSIQQGEFGVPITRADQPDIEDITGHYQVRNGNFWLALHQGALVGTIALLDGGEGLGVLRKMFVHSDFRGGGYRTAGQLLDTLMTWAEARPYDHIILGTIERMAAARRFYEKNGFVPVAVEDLPAHFPRMFVDTHFFERRLNRASP
jgi:putative acetyltransferase